MRSEYLLRTPRWCADLLRGRRVFARSCARHEVERREQQNRSATRFGICPRLRVTSKAVNRERSERCRTRGLPDGDNATVHTFFTKAKSAGLHKAGTSEGRLWCKLCRRDALV